MEIERSLRSICLFSNLFFGRLLSKKVSYRIENGKAAVYLHRVRGNNLQNVILTFFEGVTLKK